ncbi:death domain-associated protein [Halobacteriales archaeon SW_7_68_16]|nr:MAG: death domain-associated protein [Halobacteriales archaeon SW_7_68_16]
MGFGSYDESDQESQQIDTDADDESVATEENAHDGQVEFEFGESNEELIDRLEEIKEDAS